MSIQATCSCGAAFNAKAELAGKTVPCPRCGQPFCVPLPQTDLTPIRVRCRCGGEFHAKPQLAGKRLKCPSCASNLTVPNPHGAAARIRVACPCGRAFKVAAELAGRRVRCPGCRQPLKIPAAEITHSSPRQRSAAGHPDVDPLGLPASSDDPLGLGDLATVPLSSPTLPPSGQSKTLPSSTHAAYRAPRAKRTRKSGGDYDWERILEVATGILAIYHGASKLYQAAFWVIAMVRLSSLTGARSLASFHTLLFLLGVAASAGILAGGIGVLMRRDWGLEIGGLASYVYFGLLALGFLFGLIAMARIAVDGNGDLGAKVFTNMLLWTLPRVICDSLGPGMLLFLQGRQDG